MGYNKENFKRIRAEYETKTFAAQAEAEARRAELYREIPALREMDQRLSTFGLRIMESALSNRDTQEQVSQLRAENERVMAARAALLQKYGYPADYTEPKYECAECRDTGYVGIRMCKCMRNSLIEAGMQSSGLSALMSKQSFDNFSLDFYKANPREHQIMKKNFASLRSYAEGFTIEQGKPMPPSLLFYGGTGLGKTHLSTAVARVVIERGYDVYYNSAVGMLSAFEHRRFGNGVVADENDDTARYTDCDLLILDDLGTETVNQFTLSCLYHVINTRLNMGIAILIIEKSPKSRMGTTITNISAIFPPRANAMIIEKINIKGERIAVLISIINAF